jgi:hypothetical protein
VGLKLIENLIWCILWYYPLMLTKEVGFIPKEMFPEKLRLPLLKGFLNSVLRRVKPVLNKVLFCGLLWLNRIIKIQATSGISSIRRWRKETSTRCKKKHHGYERTESGHQPCDNMPSLLNWN